MSRCVLGMDVSKKDISLALLKDNRFFEKTIPNSPSGFKEILNFLQKHNSLKAECFLESTGSYSEAVADFLFDHKFIVKVVNPFKIKSFSRSGLSRVKTDKKDAQLIAKYGAVSSNDPNYQKPSEVVDLFVLCTELILLKLKCLPNVKITLNTLPMSLIRIFGLKLSANSNFVVKKL